MSDSMFDPDEPYLPQSKVVVRVRSQPSLYQKSTSGSPHITESGSPTGSHPGGPYAHYPVPQPYTQPLSQAQPQAQATHLQGPQHYVPYAQTPAPQQQPFNNNGYSGQHILPAPTHAPQAAVPAGAAHMLEGYGSYAPRGGPRQAPPPAAPTYHGHYGPPSQGPPQGYQQVPMGGPQGPPNGHRGQPPHFQQSAPIRSAPMPTMTAHAAARLSPPMFSPPAYATMGPPSTHTALPGGYLPERRSRDLTPTEFEPRAARSHSQGSLGSVGMMSQNELVPFGARSPCHSHSHSSGSVSPCSLSGTFVLGTGSKPLPFDAGEDDNPLKAKWDRRRRQQRNQLGKAVLLPSEYELVTSHDEIRSMAAAITKDVTDAAAELKQRQAEAGGPAGTPVDLSAEAAAEVEHRLRNQKPPPPAGFSSYREMLRFIQRTFLCIHLIGVDSSRRSNLFLILIATHAKIYAVDVANLDADGMRAVGLSDLFEHPGVTKISFDCRPDVEVLQQQYGIRMRGVCDLQVMATLSISPRGSFMLGRKAMFQRLFLVSDDDELAKERLTAANLCPSFPDLPPLPFPVSVVECAAIDVKYLFIAYFMLDHFEAQGREMGERRVWNTIAGNYNKSTQRDF